LFGHPIGGWDRRDAVSERVARAIPAAGRRAVPALLPILLFLASLSPATATAKPSSTPFSIEPGSFEVTPSTHTAGSHPDLTIAFGFAHSADERPFNDVKDTVIDLPPGFAGAPSAVPVCSDAQLLAEGLAPSCPLDSQLGTITASFSFPGTTDQAKMTLPLFNMEPSGPSTAAELGFRTFLFSQLIPMSIRLGDGGLTVSVPDIPLFAEPRSVSIAIWGTPASPDHDAQRGRECVPVELLAGEESCSGGGEPATAAIRPFLDNPTRCGPATARIEADSWEEPESWSEAEAEAGPIAECEQVPFAPTVTVKPTSDAAESRTGLDLSIFEPQGSDPEAPVSSSLDGAAVTLPEGLTVDPAAAATLGACTPVELEHALKGTDGGCPPDSKIGSAEIEAPLLEEAATGSVYLAKPFDNSLGSLFAFYLLAKLPGADGVVKLAGRLQPDPQSGLLRIALDEIPQLPLSRVALRLPAGADSLLATPASCGTYAAQAELTPSSSPTTPWQGSSSFEIDHGSDGGSCPPAGGLPFSPSFAAAPSRTRAGAFTALDLRLVREPGEAPFAGVSLGLPAGMAANLGAVAPCPEAALATIANRSGAEERAEPSCPGESEIGHVSLSAGAGSQLARLGGRAFLAGPYGGAARSVMLVIPALLGPFDLGTVAVRDELRVDPRTGEVTIGSPGSDSLPRLLDGIPLRLRELDVSLDRRRFLRNPTSCRPQSLLATMTTTGADLGAGRSSATLSVPFRATGCHRLGFAPRPRLRLLGALHRNGHPGLRLVLASGRGEAGLAGAAIELPSTELLDSGHIHDVCTRARFAAGRCPASSAYGFARASTPFLAEPLEGHVYLRATRHGLPSLAAALSSREISLDFVARLKAGDNGLRIAPESIPDLPASKLMLEIDGGRRGLLVNSTDLCTSPAHARARFSAQNGRHRKLTMPLQVSCHRHGGGSGRRGSAKTLEKR
jgi:hypothetical protein